MVKKEIVDVPKFKKSLNKLELFGIESYIDQWVRKEYPEAKSHKELMNLYTDEVEFFTLMFSNSDESFWIDKENWGAYFAVSKDNAVVLVSNNEQNETKYWEI
jgi:hypothetical protein